MNRGIGARRAFGRAAVRSGLAAIMAVSLLTAFVGTAAAHMPRASLTCDGGLQVTLVAYNLGGDNTVAVSIDGVAVDGSPFTFGEDFQDSWSAGSPYEPHTALVVVSAWDDPTGDREWSRTFELSIPACQDRPTPTPTTDPTPTPTTDPTPTPTTNPTPTPTSTPDFEETPTPSANPTPTPKPTPSGTVVPATGTPRITPPSTDSFASNSGTSGPGTGLVLVLVLLGGASLALVPVAGRARRR